MSEIRKIHNNAMNIAENAYLAKLKGDIDKYLELYHEAFYLEKEAAMMLVNKYDIEPSRSVLFRSAASMAFICGMHKEAEKLIAHGLSGNPPYDIAEELRNLYEEVNFNRHLKVENEKVISNLKRIEKENNERKNEVKEANKQMILKGILYSINEIKLELDIDAMYAKEELNEIYFNKIKNFSEKDNDIQEIFFSLIQTYHDCHTVIESQLDLLYAEFEDMI